MSDVIKLLPDNVANQIAAGEVVQRPASVVKELLENAIDAGATKIKLIIKEAGKMLIQVIDDGKGMSMTDLRMAFERHATSKIRTTEDIFSIHTKGFRGEALASIAAVSQLEAMTSRAEDTIGSKIKIEGGKTILHDNVAYEKGSSIAVKNLFYNIPARRNFLKSNQVETKHIINEFYRVALTHPDIGFYLYNNDSELYRLPATNIKQRIINTLGDKYNEKLIPVEEQVKDINISGFVIKPEFAKKTNTDQYFFVNNRFIKNSYLHHAVKSAFEGLIPVGYQPSYFLYFDLLPSFIDINIHPTKTEIKFEEDQMIYMVLKSAIKHSLGQFTVSPQLDFTKDDSLEVPYTYKDKTPNAPHISVDTSFNPFDTQTTTNPSKSTSANTHLQKKAPWEALYTDMPKNTQQTHLEIVSNPDVQQQKNVNAQKLFQLDNNYIVTIVNTELMIINQNRADQRVLYEKYRRILKEQKNTSQQLLFPIELVFSEYQIMILQEIKASLTVMGFDIMINNQTAQIKAMPMEITDDKASDFLERIMENFTEGDLPQPDIINDLLAKNLCKSMAIKNGVPMQKEKQEALIGSLFACSEPQLSPFNKKIFKQISIENIKKELT